jgi:outer membrane protein assembly factor BamB
MGRRRALAALAGMASAGLVVAGWELTRPGPAVAGKLTATDQTSQRSAGSARPRSRPGTLLWSAETNAAVGSLAVGGGVVYAGTAQRAVYAFDALTGRPLWHHQMSHGDTGVLDLALANGAVIASNGYNGVAPAYYYGGVYALDPGTGKLLWSADAPYVIGLDVVGDVVYAGTAIKDVFTYGVTALSTRTGELLWTVNFPENADYAGGLAVADGVVYATTSLGEIFAFDASSGGQIWRSAYPAVAFRTAPGVANGILYASSSTSTAKQSKTNLVLYALRARTGGELWRRPLGAGLYSLTVQDGAGLVFASVFRERGSSSPDAGELLALNAATGQPLWQAPVAGGATSATSVPGNVLYTGSGTGELRAWQADTGNRLWSYRATGTVNTDIQLNGGIAYFGTTGRRVYAIATGS